MITKDHLKHVNPQAKQVEDACKRLKTNSINENTDVACALCDLHHDGESKQKTLRLNLPHGEKDKLKLKKTTPPQCLDLPYPQHGNTYTPMEIWNAFAGLQTAFELGMHAIAKKALTLALTSENNTLVPVKRTQLHELMSKEKHDVPNNWNALTFSIAKQHLTQ